MRRSSVKSPGIFTLSGHPFLHPLAITMWDFSWIERRWPGAGYEDWDQALDELKVRGYDAVRIDAYPHLTALGPEREWEILPEWSTQDWGSQSLNRVQLQPSLNQFIEKCAVRNIWVGLSTWFQTDTANSYETIKTPQDLGNAWKTTLDTIADAGLLENILYVDLVNEWPIEPWTPFLTAAQRSDAPLLRQWVRESIALLRQSYPNLSYTFSGWSSPDLKKEDASDYDLFDFHIWMSPGEFYEQVGYNYERFGSEGYDNVAKNAERVYRERPDYWKSILQQRIDEAVANSELAGLPLITTESWAIVDYKDWPLLSWDWVKELCEFGVIQAAETGRWVAIGTSNFAGPQFAGMWRDVRWHQRLTDVIHEAAVDKDLLTS